MSSGSRACGRAEHTVSYAWVRACRILERHADLDLDLDLERGNLRERGAERSETHVSKVVMEEIDVAEPGERRGRDDRLGDLFAVGRGELEVVPSEVLGALELGGLDVGHEAQLGVQALRRVSLELLPREVELDVRGVMPQHGQSLAPLLGSARARGLLTVELVLHEVLRLDRHRDALVVQRDERDDDRGLEALAHPPLVERDHELYLARAHGELEHLGRHLSEREVDVLCARRDDVAHQCRLRVKRLGERDAVDGDPVQLLERDGKLVLSPVELAHERLEHHCREWLGKPLGVERAQSERVAVAPDLELERLIGGGLADLRRRERFRKGAGLGGGHRRASAPTDDQATTQVVAPSEGFVSVSIYYLLSTIQGRSLHSSLAQSAVRTH